MRRQMINAVLVVAAYLLTCVAIASGSYFNAGLTIEVDTVSEMRIRAPRDAEDVAGTERNREAALARAEGLDEVFTVNHDDWITVSDNLSLYRAELDGIREAYRIELEEYEAALAEWEEQLSIHEDVSERILSEHQQQVNAAREEGLPIPPAPTIALEPERPEWEGAAFLIFADLPISFSEAQQYFIAEADDALFLQMWDAVEAAANVVQNTEIIRNKDIMTERAVREALRNYTLDRTTDGIAEHIVLFSLKPNAIPNAEVNEQRYEEAASNYVIALIYEGDIIVDEGDIITQEIYDTLVRFHMLAPESIYDHIYPLLGVFFLIAVVFLVCIMFLAFYRKTIVTNFKEALLLFTLYTLTLVLVWTLSDFSFPYLPILIFPMLVSILIERRTATVLTFSLILICFFVVDGDLTYLMFYITAGMLFCMFSRYTTDRGKSIWVGLLISAIMFLVAIAVMLIFAHDDAFEDLQAILITAGFAAASGILTVFLCMGSLPLWETFFGVVTPIKLLDLTNPQNLLLRRLTIEAPGTYHHSLIVANLAETAAYDIGANPQAARVGGYYHDVGKLKFPHYFVENLDGENPHDHLEPKNSTQIIMSHVSYGLTLASEHRLPQFVRDIIREHHGTTLLQFFYSKAKETDGECNEKDFRYPFIIPQTRESACVMLADSVEAAVRSMIPKIKSVDEVEKTIRLIIRGKLNDGQLAESQLSIKDITVIEQSFYRVLKGMYHERIAYPKPDEKSEK